MHVNRDSQRGEKIFPRSTASQQQGAVSRTYNRLNRFSSSNSNLQDLLIRLIQLLIARLSGGGKRIKPQPPKDEPVIRPVYGAPIVQPPKDEPIAHPVYGAPIVNPPKEDPIIRPVYGAPVVNTDAKLADK